MSGLKSKYAIPSQVICTEIAGEIVLMDMARDTVFGIGEVGMSIWNSLTKGMAYQEMVEAMLTEYAVERSILEKDVQQFLESLVNKGLLQANY